MGLDFAHWELFGMLWFAIAVSDRPSCPHAGKHNTSSLSEEMSLQVK